MTNSAKQRSIRDLIEILEALPRPDSIGSRDDDLFAELGYEISADPDPSPLVGEGGGEADG